MIFNLIIGNHDAHAKNFSLLYMSDSSVRLAPLYDLVSTVFYPELSNKMAMKIGGEARSERIFPSHFEKFARDAGMAGPATLVRVSTLAAAIREAIPKVDKPGEISERIAALIAERCEMIISRFRKQ
jgi:serine/threonine-protein kinase HipA